MHKMKISVKGYRNEAVKNLVLYFFGALTIIYVGLQIYFYIMVT